MDCLKPYFVKTYDVLTETEIEKLYLFSKKIQPLGTYEDIKNMKKYFAGPLLGNGSQHLSLWINDLSVASVGWIDKGYLAIKRDC